MIQKLIDFMGIKKKKKKQDRTQEALLDIKPLKIVQQRQEDTKMKKKHRL